MRKMMLMAAAVFCVAGAWAGLEELVVTTTSSAAVAGKVRLVDAVTSAINDVGTGNLRTDGRYRITFADSLFADGAARIEFQGSVIGNGHFSAYPLEIDAGSGRGVVLTPPSGSGSRALTIGIGNVVRLRNLSFDGYDVGTGPGGAIDSRGDLKIDNCRFGACTANGGGAVHAGGGKLVVRGCSFDDNRTKAGSRGAALLVEGAKAFVLNATIRGCQTEDHKVSWAVCGSGAGTDLLMANVTCTRNFGGVRAEDCSRVAIVNSILLENCHSSLPDRDLSVSGTADVRVESCLYEKQSGVADASLVATSQTSSFWALEDRTDPVYEGVEHVCYMPKGAARTTGVCVYYRDSPWTSLFGYVKADGSTVNIQGTGSPVAADYVTEDQLGIGTGKIQGRSIGAMCNPASWTYVVDASGTLTGITGESPATLDIPGIVGGVTVVEIGDRAFKESAVEDVRTPSTLLRVGEQAFYSCESLQYVNFQASPNLEEIGEKAFYDCGALQSASFYGCYSLKTIGAGAFAWCRSLAEFDAANLSALKEIGDEAFYACKSLSTVNLNNDGQLLRIGASAFDGCEALSTLHMAGCTALKVIDDDAFSGTALASFDISGLPALQRIGEGAFVYCPLFTSVNLSSTSLQEIGDWAFAYTPLASVQIPDSVTTLADAFYYCTNLTSVTLGASTPYSDQLFNDCPELGTVDVAAGHATLKSVDGILYDISGGAGAWTLLRMPRAAAVPAAWPADLAVIGEKSCEQVSTLTSLVLPEGVTTVRAAFYGCTNLASVVLPDSVVTLAPCAFERCFALSEVELGAGIATVEPKTFEQCFDLQSVAFGNTSVQISSTAFQGVTNTAAVCTFTPPAGMAFAGWRKDGAFDVSLPENLGAFDLTGGQPAYMLSPEFRALDTLTFDAAGGAPVPAPVVDVAGRAIAIPVEPAKAGFYFAGWFEDAGLTIPASWTMQPGGGTYHAKWSEVPLTFTLTFDTNGGSAVAPVSADAGTPLTEPPAPTKSGYVFAGWYSDVGCSLPFVFSTMPAMNLTVYAKWVDDLVPLSTLTFDSCGGTTVHPVTAPVGTSLAVPADPVREGYVFDGWYADAACTTAFSFTYMPADSVTVYARWRGETYILSFDANGGTCSVFTQPVVYQGTVGGLPVAERPRYRFDGWFAGNDLVTESTVWSVPGDATLVARWTKAAPDLYSAPADTPFMGNASYSGWIRDENGAVKGFVTVKAGKAAKPERGGAAKLTVTYTPVGGRKITVKPAPVVATNQVAEIEIPGVGTFNLGGLSAASGTAEIQLGRDLLKDKDRAVKAAAAARVAGMDGVWTFALGTGLGDAGLSLTVRKGKAKLAGVLPNGDKVSLSAQGVLGESALAIPFVYSKKSAFALVFWIGDDRSVTVSDMTSVTMGGTSYEPTLVPPALLSAAGLADGTHTFRAGAYAQDFAASARKWDAGKKDVNPAGLKLKLAPKTGLVTGSFKGDAGKMTVAGALVDGVFHGAAFSRATPGVPATIE